MLQGKELRRLVVDGLVVERGSPSGPVFPPELIEIPDGHDAVDVGLRASVREGRGDLERSRCEFLGTGALDLE